MLNLDEQPATVTSLNVRAERHGDSPVPACDIGIRFETGAKVLDSFAKGLRDAMYEDEEGVKERKRQSRVPGTGEDDASGPQLRFNGAISALNIKKEWPGYEALVVWGDLASSVKIKLKAVMVTRIKAEPMNGGSCEVSLQLQCHPKQEDYGDLANLIQREVKLSLEPPTAADLKKLEKQAEKNAAKEKKEEKPEDKTKGE